MAYQSPYNDKVAQHLQQAADAQAQAAADEAQTNKAIETQKQRIQQEADNMIQATDDPNREQEIQAKADQQKSNVDRTGNTGGLF